MSSDLTPFSLFESFERIPLSHAEPVNRAAYEKMWNALSVPHDHRGRCILLRAPRAGHGKTHLLARLHHHLGAGFEFIPIYPSDGSHVDAASVLEDVLCRLTRALSAGGGLTMLDLYSRRLFAAGLQPLVRSGEVPCQDREGALAALRNRPIETFDFHHPNAVTAHWTKENIEVLGPRLSLELSRLAGTSLSETAFWVEHLFRFAASPIEQPGRSGMLIQSTLGDHALSRHSAMERLASLLALLSLLVRVVLIADELEGFSADDDAALRFSAFLGAVRHGADRVDAVLSVNTDIWESAFLPRLSGGLSDRLSEVVVDLEPLADEEIRALLESRVPGSAERLQSKLTLSAQERYARKILREICGIMQSQTFLEPLQPEIPDGIPAGNDFQPAQENHVTPEGGEPLPQPGAASGTVFEPASIQPTVQSVSISGHATSPPAPTATATPVQGPPAVSESPFRLAAENPPSPPSVFVSPQTNAAVVPSTMMEPASPAPEAVGSGGDSGLTSQQPESRPVVAPGYFEDIATPVVPDLTAIASAPAQSFVPEQNTFNAAAALAIWQQQGGKAPVATSAEMLAQSVPEQHQPPHRPEYQNVSTPVVSTPGRTTPSPVVPQSPPTPQMAAVEVPSTDRVDDLLRQFRERYGRG